MLYCKIFWLLTFKAKRVRFRAMDLYGYIWGLEIVESSRKSFRLRLEVCIRARNCELESPPMNTSVWKFVELRLRYWKPIPRNPAITETLLGQNRASLLRIGMNWLLSSSWPNQADSRVPTSAVRTLHLTSAAGDPHQGQRFVCLAAGA
jgi:hypothetical protein